MPDPIAFAQPTNNQIHISPQLALATFQFLQTGELLLSDRRIPGSDRRAHRHVGAGEWRKGGRGEGAT